MSIHNELGHLKMPIRVLQKTADSSGLRTRDIWVKSQGPRLHQTDSTRWRVLVQCKNEYIVFALGRETAAQAVIRSIVWAFRELEEQRCRGMSARCYAFHIVCRQPSFFHKQFNKISQTWIWFVLSLLRLSVSNPR